MRNQWSRLTGIVVAMVIVLMLAIPSLGPSRHEHLLRP